MKTVIEKPSTFEAVGNVIGKLWGGGIGGYPAVRLATNNKEQMMNLIKKRLMVGSLDSGMGFQELLIAEMCIIEKKVIFHDEHEYTTEIPTAYCFIVKERMNEWTADYIKDIPTTSIIYVEP